MRGRVERRTGKEQTGVGEGECCEVGWNAQWPSPRGHTTSDRKPRAQPLGIQLLLKLRKHHDKRDDTTTAFQVSLPFSLLPPKGSDSLCGPTLWTPPLSHSLFPFSPLGCHLCNSVHEIQRPFLNEAKLKWLDHIDHLIRAPKMLMWRPSLRQSC